MSVPLDDLMRFEYYLEEGFSGILKAIPAITVYDSQTRSETAVTPRVEVKVVVGSYLEHRHTFKNGAIVNGAPINADIFDSYEGVIEVTIVTNRKVDKTSDGHRRLLGAVRTAMLKWHVIFNWPGDKILPVDIRPTGTADTFQDENDLDYSVLSHLLVFEISNLPGIWPETIS